jgi:PAS domain-containing protein
MTNGTLYETVPVGLWRIDINTKELVHANKTALQILGYSNIDEMNSCVDCKKIFSSTMESQNNLDILITNHDGKRIWVELSGQVNSQGFIEGTIRDITSSKVYESSIKKNIEKISLLKRNIIKRLEEENLSKIVKTA